MRKECEIKSKTPVQGYVKVVKSRVPRDSRSLGGARGVLASFPFLPPPCALTERQLAAQQRCQDTFQVPKAAKEHL
jgi:hypothetical protein